MQMQGFWSNVTNVLTPEEVKKQYPDAWKAAEYHELTSGVFAYDVIPAVGPGGYTSDEDEEADTDDDMPSVSGDKSLMVYLADVDELHLFTDVDWYLWNY